MIELRWISIISAALEKLEQHLVNQAYMQLEESALDSYHCETLRIASYRAVHAAPEILVVP